MLKCTVVTTPMHSDDLPLHAYLLFMVEPSAKLARKRVYIVLWEVVYRRQNFLKTGFFIRGAIF